MAKKSVGRPARKVDNKLIRSLLLSKTIPVETVQEALSLSDTRGFFEVNRSIGIGSHIILKVLMSLEVISTQTVSDLFNNKAAIRYYREISRIAARASGLLAAKL
ncbi:hypothetical protein [Pantoea sp. UBA5037]|uniref:hypothetical protein n=1 Tax=Pantoea sp. UBA5037 TaxID=1947036 RepID=UPI00257E6A01|nr:hypothetical protein [Pantoea sp. UBA5037]